MEKLLSERHNDAEPGAHVDAGLHERTFSSWLITVARFHLAAPGVVLSAPGAPASHLGRQRRAGGVAGACRRRSSGFNAAMPARHRAGATFRRGGLRCTGWRRKCIWRWHPAGGLDADREFSRCCRSAWISHRHQRDWHITAGAALTPRRYRNRCPAGARSGVECAAADAHRRPDASADPSGVLAPSRLTSITCCCSPSARLGAPGTCRGRHFVGLVFAAVHRSGSGCSSAGPSSCSARLPCSVCPRLSRLAGPGIRAGRER